MTDSAQDTMPADDTLLARGLVKWLCHDLATPIASVMTASELLGDAPDAELNGLILDGTRRLAARLRLVRLALTAGDVAIGGAALAKLVREGLEGTPVDWQRAPADEPASMAALVAAAAMLLADLNRTKPVTVLDDRVVLNGPAMIPDAVRAALMGLLPTDNRSAVAAMLVRTAALARHSVIVLPDGIAWHAD